MVTRIRQRLSADEGLTLVEMLVAMVVLAITLLALSSTLITSLRAMMSSETRVRANALANETLENLQVRDWGDTAPGWDDIEDDYPDCDPQPEPLEESFTEERDGLDYTVTSVIEWVDDPSTAEDCDYLKLTATVEWQLRTETRSVTHSAFRAPPAEEDPSELAVRSLRVDPEIALLKSAGDPDPGKVEQRVEFDEDGDPTYSTITPDHRVELTLVTTAPLPGGASVTVSFMPRDEWPDGSDSGPHSLTSVDQETWTLARDDWQFVNGDTTFKFFIDLDPADPDSLTLDVTKVVRYVHEDIDVVEGPGADVDEVCLDGDRNSLHPVEVTAHFSGLTADDDVVVSGAGLGDDPPQIATFDGRTTSGGDVIYTIPAEHPYPNGSTTDITLTAIRGFDNTVTASGTLEDLPLLAPGDDDYEDACG
jgi:prepilin-type N-terminal cleavage/methylation domain-containing protein